MCVCCMCWCACRGWYKYIRFCAYADGDQRSTLSVLSQVLVTSFLCFTGSPAGLVLGGRVKDSLVSTFPELGLQECATAPHHFMRVVGQIMHPHAHRASTLPTKPSPGPLWFFPAALFAVHSALSLICTSITKASTLFRGLFSSTGNNKSHHKHQLCSQKGRQWGEGSENSFMCLLSLQSLITHSLKFLSLKGTKS